MRTLVRASASGYPESVDEISRDASPATPAGTPAPRPDAPAAGPPAEVAAADLRASDADRDRVADILREALAHGRLDPEEHAERIDRLYQAKTFGELQVLIRDLPEGQAAGSPLPPPPQTAPPHSVPGKLGENLLAIFSAAARKGRWRVGNHISAFACFGSVEIDLTEALFEHPHVTINATSILGSVEIRVPENVSLRGTGTGVLGGYEVETREAADPHAPVVVVTGAAVLGSVEAKPRRGAFLRNLRGWLHKGRGDGAPPPGV